MDFRYEKLETIAILSANAKTGWRRELNLISWNGNEPKYDIRDWSADGVKMGKGIGLTKDELTILAEALKGVL